MKHTSTQGQSGSQLTASTDATRTDVGSLESLCTSGLQDVVADVLFARVPGTFEAIEGDDVNAQPLGREGVADGDALVDGDATGVLEKRDPLLGVAAGGLDDPHPFFDDHLGVLLVRRRRAHCGQDGEVHSERLVSQLLGPADPLSAAFRRAGIVSCKRPQCPGV